MPRDNSVRVDYDRFHEDPLDGGLDIYNGPIWKNSVGNEEYFPGDVGDLFIRNRGRGDFPTDLGYYHYYYLF